MFCFVFKSDACSLAVCLAVSECSPLFFHSDLVLSLNPASRSVCVLDSCWDAGEQWHAVRHPSHPHSIDGLPVFWTETTPKL